MEVSGHVSYKTLKIYLLGIQLEHLEHGFKDPTDDEVLHLVCRGIRRLLGDNNCRTHCPITINLLRILKTQLSRSAAYTILEQRLLWAAFFVSQSQLPTHPPVLHHYCTLVPPTNRIGPLFNGGRFAPLSRVHITSVVRLLLQGTGVNQTQYSSHSFSHWCHHHHCSCRITCILNQDSRPLEEQCL